MPRLKITKKAVEAAPIPIGKDELYWDTDGEGPRGFGFRVTPKGVRSYIFQYRVGGAASRRMTIGQHGAWTAERARQRAKELARDVDVGIDPVQAEKTRRRQAVTLEFGSYLDTFRDGYLKTEWGSSWEQAYRQLEMHVLPYLKGTALPALTKADINSVFDKLKGRPALARNAWAALSKLMNWAARRGDIPVNLMAAMDAPPTVAARKRTLSDAEILALWRATLSFDRPFGEFIRLLLITLQRRSEVAELPWKELSRLESLWRLPADRAKNNLDHLVPLSTLATELLEGMGWKHRAFAFSTTGTTPISGFSKIKKRLDEAMLTELQKIEDERAEAAGQAPDEINLEGWRLHDLRRTGTTQMQRLGIGIEVTERVINHHQGGSASGIRGIYNLYDYQDEKRRALQAWADWLSRLINAAEEAPNVVPIAAQRS